MDMIHYSIYKLEGKPWVTFVHGAGGSSRIFYKQLNYFKSQFNVLLIDLRGHGKSAQLNNSSCRKYTFNIITKDILDILDKEQIKKTNMIGISMGSIIIRNFVNLYPNRIDKAVLGGMVVKFNNFTLSLLYITRIIKNIAPVMLLYKALAKIILPKKAHKSSKNKFIREAKKLTKQEFLNWFGLTKELPSVFASFETQTNVPILYIQGAEDHLFINDVKKHVANRKSETLKIIPDCGHLINLQSPTIFNYEAAKFLLQ